MEAAFRQTCENAIGALNSYRDPVSKELRDFETSAYPPLMEFVESLLPLLDSKFCSSKELVRNGWSLSYGKAESTSLAWSDFIINGVSRVLARRSRIFVYAGGSTKTIAPGSLSNVREEARIMLKKSGLARKLISLENLVEALCPALRPLCLEADSAERLNYYFRVLNELSDPSGRESQIVQDFVRNQRMQLPPLEMKVRFYPARADLRAYYTDPFVLRQVIGAAIPKLIIPHTKDKQAWLWRNFRGQRDELDLTVTAATGDWLLVILLDLSSATHNAVNIHAILLGIIVMLKTVSNDLNKKVRIQVAETIVETTVSDWLELYLSLTFLAPANHGKQNILSYGGYLGVNGDADLFLLLMGTVLYMWKGTIFKGLNYRYQQGGDDTAIVVTGPLDLLTTCVQRVKDETFKYLSVCKVFGTSYFQIGEDGLATGAYCRKAAKVEWFNANAVVSNERSYPVPLSFFIDPPDHLDYWAYISSLKTSLGSKLDTETIAKYNHLWLELRGPTEDYKIRNNQLIVPDLILHTVGPHALTEVAYSIVFRFRENNPELAAELENEDLVIYLLRAEKLKMTVTTKRRYINGPKEKLTQQATSVVDLVGAVQRTESLQLVLNLKSFLSASE